MRDMVEFIQYVIECAVIHGQRYAFKQLLLVPGADVLQAVTFGVALLHRLLGQELVVMWKALLTN